jgi:hypothetical protein
MSTPGGVAARPRLATVQEKLPLSAAYDSEVTTTSGRARRAATATKSPFAGNDEDGSQAARTNKGQSRAIAPGRMVGS